MCWVSKHDCKTMTRVQRERFLPLLLVFALGSMHQSWHLSAVQATLQNCMQPGPAAGATGLGRWFANCCTTAGKPRSTPTQLPQSRQGKEQLPLTGRPCVQLRRAEGCQDEAELSGVIWEKPLC